MAFYCPSRAREAEKTMSMYKHTFLIRDGGGYVSCIFLQFLYDSFKVGKQEPFLHVLQMCCKETGKTSWRSESMFGHALKCGSWLLLSTIITTIKSAESKSSQRIRFCLIATKTLGGTAATLVHFRTHNNTAAFYFNEIKKGRHPTLTPPFFSVGRIDPVIWSLQTQTICGFSTGNQTTLWSRRLSSSGKN